MDTSLVLYVFMLIGMSYSTNSLQTPLKTGTNHHEDHHEDANEGSEDSLSALSEFYRSIENDEMKQDENDNNERLVDSFNRLGSLASSSSSDTGSPNVVKPVLPTVAFRGDCGVPALTPRTKQRIVGGDEAIPHSWPWVANLQWNIKEKQRWIHVCGGTLISARCCVTAAHCVFPLRDVSEYRIILGQHDLRNFDGAETVYGVAEVIPHEAYTMDADTDDIALFKLNKEVVFNGYISPVCLPETKCPDGTLCFATGWGNTQGTGNQYVLNQVCVPKMSSDKCVSFYRDLIGSTMMCNGYDTGAHDSCSGDSGGSVVAQVNGKGKWYFHGVTSWGIGCAQPGKPGVYTAVFFYKDWIQKHCFAGKSF